MATEQSQSVQIGSAEKDLSRPLRSHWSSIKRAPGQAENSKRVGPLRVLCVLCCVNEPCAGSERATEQPWGKQKAGPERAQLALSVHEAGPGSSLGEH